MVRKLIVIMLCLIGLTQIQAQEPSKSPKDVWNDVYSKRFKDGKFPYSAFLAEVIKTRKPGKALDIGIGEGRNAFLLAEQGWEVTGFDISNEGVKQAREEAQKRKLKLEALVDDVDRFDYGKERWDLVAGMYMHEMITRNADKIIESLKPGGIVVIEGFHRDLNQKGVQGGYFGYQTNQLLRAFDRLRILYYEEAKAVPYWLKDGKEAPIVRFIAVKEPRENKAQ